MKRILFAIFSLTLTLNALSQLNASKKICSGWVVYMPDSNVIYFNDNNKSEHHSFFYANLYEGVVLNGYPKIESLKKYASKIKVYEWKNNKEATWLYIMPVKAQVINKPSIDTTQIEHRSFYKNGKEIQFSFRILNNYEVITLTPTLLDKNQIKERN